MNDGYFFVRHQERIFGPFRVEKIKNMLLTHMIDADALVSQDKQVWMSLETIWTQESSPEFSGTSDAPEPPENDFSSAVCDIPLRTVRTEESVEAPEEQDEAVSALPSSSMPEESACRIIGASLQLIWNTQDRLMFLFRLSCLRKIGFCAAAAYLFSLLMAALCWLSIIRYGLPPGKMALFIAVYTAFFAVVIPLEFWMLRVIFGTGRGTMRETWLLSSLTMENTAVLSVLIFLGYFAMLRLRETGLTFLMLPLAFLLLFAGAFFVANLTAGLLRGLRRAFHFRSRHGVWCAALIVAQFLWFFVIAFILMRRYI